MAKKAIKTKHLLLVGGGHSHLNVIKQLGLNPPKNTRITLISQDRFTPYSGMLPGLIAGHYPFSAAHIDLAQLCQRYGIEFIHKEVTHINPLQQQLSCSDQMTLSYDCLSLNIGSRPATHNIKGAEQHGIAVKPIAEFLDYWRQKSIELATEIKASHRQHRIAIVGGGAAGIEVAFACQYSLQRMLGNNIKSICFSLYSANETLLPDASQRVQQTLADRLARREINTHLAHPVTEVVQEESAYKLHFAEQTAQPADFIIWTINATGSGWVSNTGLHCNNQHFVTVNRFLQSTSHNNVFAAGDIAHFSEQPLAKSGVYAVRAGEVLSQNLNNFLNHQALIPFKPQQQFLKLLTTGERYAVASKGRFFAKGKWVWYWKNWIDRRFVKQYQ